MNKKFAKLSVIEEAGWKEEETLVRKMPARKLSTNTKSKVATSGSSGLRALIAAKRKASRNEASPVCEEDRPKTVVDDRHTVPAFKVVDSPVFEDGRTFEGGFFTVKSPLRTTPSPAKLLAHRTTPSPAKSPLCLTPAPHSAKSTDGDRLRRSVLTGSTGRMSSLVSPFVSAMSRRSMAREASPVARSLCGGRVTKRSGLFDDIETGESSK